METWGDETACAQIVLLLDRSQEGEFRSDGNIKIENGNEKGAHAKPNNLHETATSRYYYLPLPALPKLQLIQP